MPLFTFGDFYAGFDAPQKALKKIYWPAYSLYGKANQRIGAITDVLVDESGHFRYLVVRISAWSIDKTGLLPIGLAQFDYDQKKVFVDNLHRSQLERLPAYEIGCAVDRSYEQRVQDAYLSLAARRANRRFLQQPYTLNGCYQGSPSGYIQSASEDYHHKPIFYGMSDRDNQRPLKHYEEQLISHKQRQTAAQG